MAESDNSIDASAPDSWNIGFGVVLICFALIALFVWFPRDIIGSFIETNQVGKVGPGDAFFPVLLASAILTLSVIHLLSILVKRHAASPATIGRLTVKNLRFFVGFHLIVLTGLLTMFTLGPAAVSAINAVQGSDLNYKALVDTVPYKYIGYIGGGCLLTLPLIAWSEGGFRARSVIIVGATILASIVIFDVLLSNVQLPPNADY